MESMSVRQPGRVRVQGADLSPGGSEKSCALLFHVCSPQSVAIAYSLASSLGVHPFQTMRRSTLHDLADLGGARGYWCAWQECIRPPHLWLSQFVPLIVDSEALEATHS